MPGPSPNAIATLLVSCPDRRGIVAALAQLLYGHGANILDADQHTDPVAGQFFQRIRFDLSDMPPTARRSRRRSRRWPSASA
jgi:formyltetrahydrofolate deformylase